MLKVIKFFIIQEEKKVLANNRLESQCTYQKFKSNPPNDKCNVQLPKKERDNMFNLKTQRKTGK